MKYTLLVLLLLLTSYEAFAKRMVELTPIDKIIINDGTPIEKVGASLKFALLDKGWDPKKSAQTSPKTVTATFVDRTHSMTVKFQYSLESISFEYLESTNLNYRIKNGKARIHPTYFVWMKELKAEINSNLESLNTDLGISKVCFDRMLSNTTKYQFSLYQNSRRRVASKLCSDEPLRVLVSDKRPYVLNGDKKRTFVGLVRFYGAPITVNSKDSITMAQSVAGGVRLVLEQATPYIQTWGIIDGSTFENIADIEKITEKIALIEVKEWKVDAPGGLGKTAFYYDMEIEIRASIDGDVLAAHSVKGKEVVKSNKLIHSFYARAIESLFENMDIQKVLSTNLSEITSVDEPQINDVSIAIKQQDNPTKIDELKAMNEKDQNQPVKNMKGCSVDQILKMNNLGLDKRQIEAACRN